MYYDRLKNRIRASERAREAKNIKPERVKDHIAEVYYPLHDDLDAGQHQYINLPGGRGSGKSSFVSLEIVSRIMQDASGDSNAIVFRRTAASLRDSVFSQIAWAIDTLGASASWRSSITPMKYTYIPTGAEILFKGLDDPSKLKSIKPKKGIFRYIWMEEFCELPGENFQRSILQSVVRGGAEFTVFRSFNPPISANNWANKFVATPDARTITLLTNYTQIPEAWLGEGFLYEAERLRELNEKAYRNEYMGEATGSGGEVFPNLEIRKITDDEIAQMEYTYQGLDFGFAADPACYIYSGYDRRNEKVFLLDEIYKHGMSNSDIAEAIMEKHIPAGANTLCADCAEPKSISDIRKAGLKCYACRKFPGCVQYRIKWLQKRVIVIDPARTPNAFREFTGYEYMTDKDGNFLSDLRPGNDHSVDCLAYSLDRIIYSSKFPA